MFVPNERGNQMKVTVKCRSTNKELFTGEIIDATGSSITIKNDKAVVSTFILIDVILSFKA